MHIGELHYDGNKNGYILSGPWYLFLSGSLRNLCFNCLLALSLLLIILSTLLQSPCVFLKVVDCSK